MARSKLTLLHWDRAHQQRLAVIQAPFPSLSHTIEGKTWAGALITHDDDALFLRGQSQFNREQYEGEDNS